MRNKRNNSEETEVEYVPTQEDGVAIEPRKQVVGDNGALGSDQRNSSLPLQCPVSARRKPVWVHVCVRRVSKCQPGDGDVCHGPLLRAADVEQHLDTGGDKRTSGKPGHGVYGTLRSSIRLVVERACALVEKPLPRAVDLLDNVFNVPKAERIRKRKSTL